MKNLLRYSFILLIAYTTANSQWVNVPYDGPTVGYSDAVNEQIYWCGNFNSTGTTGTSCTTDGGQTWHSSIFTDPKGYSVYCIDALNADTAYVTTSEIFRTTDRGNTWVKQITSYSTGFVNCIHFFDSNNGVATGDPKLGYFEIYTTTNGGDNWLRVPKENIPAPLPNEVGIISSFAAYNNTFWFATFGAAAGQRIIRSTDRGYTWTLLTTFPIPSIATPTLEFRDSLHGIFIGNGYFISRTSDGGMTWATDSLPGWVTFIGDPSYIPGTSSTYTVNCFGLSGKEEIYISLVSTDDGVTWKRMDSWTSDTFIYPFEQKWISPNFGWSCFNEKGIYKWPGYIGKNIWRAASSIQFGSQAVGEIGDTFGISIGNYSTLPTTINAFTLSSAEFSLVNPPSLPIVLQPWDAIDLDIAFTPQARGLFNDSLVIFSDAENYNSLSVTLTGRGLEFTSPLPDLIYAASDSLYTCNLSNLTASPVGWFEGNQIEGLAIRPSDSILIGISTNVSSSTLHKIDPILGGCFPMLTIPVGNMRAIAYTNTGTLFAGSNTGELYNINTNTGQATLIGTTSDKQYSSFAFNPQNGKLYASVLITFMSTSPKDAIYLIDTLTGAAALLGLTGDGKSNISIVFNDDGTLYGLKGRLAETNKLITISTTDGAGTEIGTLGKRGLQAIVMRNLVTDVRDNNEGSELTSYELFQNYPNPFNSSSEIKYSIPKFTQVTLKIFNTLGEEIETLVNEEKTAGIYEITWNAADLPSGAYFYKLMSGDFVQTKKMILLK